MHVTQVIHNRYAWRSYRTHAAIDGSHRSIFVAGWRPFIGWVCGFALLWHFILFDFLTWITVNFFPQVTELPELSGTETLVTVLLSLLGLGAMRTAEKCGGKAK